MIAPAMRQTEFIREAGMGRRIWEDKEFCKDFCFCICKIALNG